MNLDNPPVKFSIAPDQRAMVWFADGDEDIVEIRSKDWPAIRRAVHRKEATERFGHIAGLEDRIAMENLAAEVIHSTADLRVRLLAAKAILRSRFDCSLERAIEAGEFSLHPSFDDYVAMNPLTVLGSVLDIAASLRREFGFEKNGHVDLENTWHAVTLPAEENLFKWGWYDAAGAAVYVK